MEKSKESDLIDVYYLGIRNLSPNTTTHISSSGHDGSDNRHIFYIPKKNLVLFSRWGYSFKRLRKFGYVNADTELGKKVKELFEMRKKEKESVRDMTPEEKEEYDSRHLKGTEFEGVSQVFYSFGSGKYEPMCNMRVMSPFGKTELDLGLLSEFTNKYDQYLDLSRSLEGLDKRLASLEDALEE